MIPTENVTGQTQLNKSPTQQILPLQQQECGSRKETHLQKPQQRQQQENERRKNDKNKFINKLKQLSTEPGSDIVTFHKTNLTFSGQTPTFDRRERNKIAARESRDRKKLYIKLMEGKIQNLEMELFKASEEIEHIRMEIFNVQMHQDSKRKEVKNKQMHIIKKLQGLISTQDLDERNNEINICLDSIIYRVGAMGNERKSALNKLYNDLINFSQPALYRYILWSAAQQKHLFQGSGEKAIRKQDQWCKEIQQIAQMCVHGRQEILFRIGQRLSQHKLQFAHSSQNLVTVKGQIQKKGQALDNIVNQIRQILNPEQVAQLILFVERNQFKKDIRLFQDEDEQQRLPTKKVKIEEVDRNQI